jgi:hypothetical protein
MTLNVVQMKSFFYMNTMITRKKMKNNIKQRRQKRSWYLDNQPTNKQKQIEELKEKCKI